MEKNATMTVQDAIAQIDDCKAAVNDHALCRTLREDDRHYTAVLNARSDGVDGIRVHKGMGKAAALRAILSKLDYFAENGLDFLD